MPSLKDIRKRIGSVKNTQKITRAMKLVAAARLRRSQDAIIAARPYAESLEKVIAELADRAGRDAHPLLEQRERKQAMVVLMTSDRGLAGSFNSQLIRTTEQYVRNELEDTDRVELRLVGRKGNAYFSRRDYTIRDFRVAPTGDTALEFSRGLAANVVEDFLEGGPGTRFDYVYLVYNEFKSAITQKPIVKQMLPIVARDLPEGELRTGDFVYEPSKPALLSHLLPLYIQHGIYRAALESIASELGARMSAMDSATRNAGEMIRKLSLDYNRARQAAITKELLEIVAGAEALKG